MNDLTIDNVIKSAYKARANYRSVCGNCGDIVDDLEGILIDRYGLPYRDRETASKYGRKQVRVGDRGEDKHYIFKMDSQFIERFQHGKTVWVDASFDQFNKQNRRDESTNVTVSFGEKEHLDSVRIMFPSDVRRYQYSNIGGNLSR